MRLESVWCVGEDADQLGIPTSFTEVDAAHRPSATGTTHVVGSPDVRLAAL